MRTFKKFFFLSYSRWIIGGAGADDVGSLSPHLPQEWHEWTSYDLGHITLLLLFYSKESLLLLFPLESLKKNEKEGREREKKSTGASLRPLNGSRKTIEEERKTRSVVLHKGTKYHFVRSCCAVRISSSFSKTNENTTLWLCWPDRRGKCSPIQYCIFFSYYTRSVETCRGLSLSLSAGVQNVMLGLFLNRKEPVGRHLGS